MKVEVVGTGCPTCLNLYKITKYATADMESHIDLKYLANQEGMKRLIELGVMQSPALVVNDKVVMIGYNPSVQKIKDLILEGSE